MGEVADVTDGGGATSTSAFAAAIERISPAVVVLRVCNVRAFDGEGRGCGSATGFVVDKKNGIILTNRHVVSPGPVQADATFLSKEEVPIVPIYRDPVHDYGFFRFNPEDVKFLELAEIPLSPQRAKVGVEVRVVGNDAGEKLSILAGTLARLDRDAPVYGNKGYNDHNTFYIAAASSTSGGSSGSPVIDSEGHAVALNAGGRTKAATSFYLPLDRVVRALDFVRRGAPVPRRTIQCIFKHNAFTEATRLGLPVETEAEIRKAFPEATGVLVANQVVPEGPTARADVHPGDILVRLNGQLLHEFLPLEDVLDESDKVELELRRGNEWLTVTVETDDLHELTPSEFLEVSGAILHPLSYNQAINHALKVGGVYVASSGFMLGRAEVSWNSLLVGVGDVETPDMATLERTLAALPEGSDVSIRFIDLREKFRVQVRSCTVDRTWFLWRKAKRNDADGLWHFEDLEIPSEPHVPRPHHIRFSEPAAATVVTVSCDVPFQCDGIPTSSFFGTGLVVDAKRGLVVCDRNTIPNSLGNVTITFGGSVEIPALVVLVHPMHNFSIVQYNPAQLEVEHNDAVTAFELHESSERLGPGDSCTFLGLSYQMSHISQRCTVTNIERLLFLLTSPPRCTSRNQMVIHVDKLAPNVGGALVDDEGKVQAFWFSFSFQSESYKNKETSAGVPAGVVFESVRALQRDGVPRDICTLGIDFVVTPMSKARAGMGLSTDWVKRLTSEDHTNTHVLTIRNVDASLPSAEVLRSGDLLLAVDDKPMASFEAAEKSAVDKEAVSVTVLRDMAELKLSVPVARVSCTGTSRLLLFAGMFLQAPHPAVAFRGFMPDVAKRGGGVYCSRWFHGSPSHRFALKATHFVVAIDDEETPNLDAVVACVSKIKTGQYVRVKTVSLNNKRSVFSLKCDYHYWPTVDLVRDPNTFHWHLNVVSTPCSES